MPLWILKMMKITRLSNKFFLKGIFTLFLLIAMTCLPSMSHAEIIGTEVNGKTIDASTEFLRDLDYETWQLVAYKSDFNDEKLVLRIIGYPGSLRIDHPLSLSIESGRKQWFLKDITLINDQLAKDPRQAAAEFDLDQLIQEISQNRPLRLSLSGVFSELPVPPFLVKEWRLLNQS